MHILLTTYGLLMIMALFAMAQWKNAETMIFTDAIASSHFQQAQEQMLFKLQERAKAVHRQASPKGKTPSEHEENEEEEEEIEEDEEEIFLPDDPDPAEGDEIQKKGKRSHLLSVAPLFLDKNASITEGKGKVCFQILKNLMDTLYSKQEFYKDYQTKQPDPHEYLILTLMDKAKETTWDNKPRTATQLFSKLKLEDKNLKVIRYLEFTGNKSVNDKQLSTLGYYPLKEFITIQQTPHLASLWLAPKALLYAIFQNHEAVTEVCQLRNELYNEQRRAKRSSKEGIKTIENLHKQKLEQCFKSYPSSFIDSQFFDFATSGTRPPKY